jgi:E3 ubiquitin-protein ligase HERC4
MKSLSPSIYRSLKSVLDYKEDDLETALCLSFVIEREFCGEIRQIELKPSGSEIMVNQKNKQEFVELYIDYIFNKSCEKQFEAFSAGFRRVINSKPLELFYPDELMSFVVNINIIYVIKIKEFFYLRLVILLVIGMNFKRKRNIKENIMLTILLCM